MHEPTLFQVPPQGDAGAAFAGESGAGIPPLPAPEALWGES